MNLWEKSLALLDSPGDWPAYPLLPVIRGRESGFLIHGHGAQVYIANMFALKRGQEFEPQLKELSSEKFETFSEVLGAGWQVD